jgi:hypothetical protein
MSKFLDLQFGLNKEKETLPIIREFFKTDIKRSSNKFQKYDFEDNEFKYELKSRNNNHDKYPTVLINADKVSNPKTILLFNFTDGLYYIKYKPIRFSKFERKSFCRSARIDANDFENLVIYIPINKLKKIN